MFSHLRECRKKCLRQLLLLERLARCREILLLRSGDVEKNPGPAAIAAATNETQIKKNKLLTAIHVNARSLLRHYDDLVSLTSAERPHIIAVSETWLDSSVLTVIVLVVVLLYIVVIISLAPCFIVLLLPLVSNPCGFL